MEEAKNRLLDNVAGLDAGIAFTVETRKDSGMLVWNQLRVRLLLSYL